MHFPRLFNPTLTRCWSSSTVTQDAEKEVDLEQYFKTKGPLHCTTKFCNYGKADGAKEYAEIPVSCRKQTSKSLFILHYVSNVLKRILSYFLILLCSSSGRQGKLWFCVRAVSERSLCHSSHRRCLSVPHRRTACTVAGWCQKGGGGCFLPTPGKPRPCYPGMCRGSGASSNRFGSAGNPGSAAGRPEGGARGGDGARLTDLLRGGKMAAQPQRAHPRPSLLLQCLRTQGGCASQKRRREKKEAEVCHSLKNKQEEVWACMLNELNPRLNLCKVCVFLSVYFQL